MSELDGVSEATGPAIDADATAWHEASEGQETADSYGGYPGVPQGEVGSYAGSDAEVMLAAEERLPEPRTRQDAAADTWGDSAGDPAGSELAPEYDGEVEALLNAEERLPESRTRHDATAATWDDTNTGQDAAPGASTGGTSPGKPDGSMESPALDDDPGEDGSPDSLARQVTVHARDGTEVPVTVEYMPPEARTVGDTTPTGIGRKPTGEELFGMEGDNPGKGRLDRIFDEAFKEADDFSDAAAHIGEAIEVDVRSGPAPSGHPHSYHAATGSAQDHPASPEPGVSDAVGSIAIVGVAAVVAIRHALSELWKEHKP